MRAQRTIAISIALIGIMIFISISQASAQSVLAVGEARMKGKSYLKSAGEQWIAAPSTYPVLQDTAIRNEEGSADVYFRDGSRVAISRNSEAVISGSLNQYLINLVRGSVAFAIAPGASLSVGAGSASVTINGNKKIVRKVSHETPGHIRGLVTLGKSGIEVRSISGTVSVAVNDAAVRDLNAGEAMVIGPDNTYKVLMAQALKDDKDKEKEDKDRKKDDDDQGLGYAFPAAAAAAGVAGAGAGGLTLTQGALLVGFTGGVAIAINDSLASPSSPGAQIVK